MSRTGTCPPLIPDNGQRVEAYVEDRLHLDAGNTITKSRALFRRYRDVAAVPVTREGKPVGWVMLQDLLGDLPPDATIGAVMRPGCTTVLRSRGLDRVLCDIGDGTLRIGEPGLLVVDERACFLGRIGLTSLLRAAAGGNEQRQRDTARLHRLTGGLPDQLALLERARTLLREKRLFVVASMDLCGFNAFNDRYGYSRGDEVIRFVSGLLRRHFDPAQDFVAYVGGDNFTMLLCSMDWFDRCEALLADCDRHAPGFYDAEDRRRGGIEQYNHLGERIFTPIFTLSIGMTQVEPGRFRDHHSLLKAARDLKLRAASNGGGAIFVEGLGGQAVDGLFGIVHH